MASAWAGTPAPSKNVAQYILCLIRENNKKLCLRGQTDVYNSQMKPSVLRKITNPDKSNKSLWEIADSFKRNNKHFKNVDNPVLYSVLQHYGIRTCWLDIVDNIWVALWFGSHCM